MARKAARPSSATLMTIPANQLEARPLPIPARASIFHSTQVTAAAFDEVAHTVTLTGSGTNNGSPVAFTIVAADRSLAAPGLFSITLSDGYSNRSNLLDGSITVY